MQLNDRINHISSHASKLIRNNFGRGPESCNATLNKNYFILYIRGFISPMEEVLLQQRKHEYVATARKVIIDHVISELKGVVESMLDLEVLEYYQDWSFLNNSGLIVLVLNELIDGVPEDKLPDIDQKRLEAEIARISELVEKVPEEIILSPVSSSIFLAVRKGILVPIEKALVKKGYKEELIITKSELEKKHFQHDGNFATIFQKKIIDLFIDWDFKKDKSLIGFILK